jgi:hypothetical protein
MHVGRSSFLRFKIVAASNASAGTRSSRIQPLLAPATGKCPSPDGNSQPGSLKAIENPDGPQGGRNAIRPLAGGTLAARGWGRAFDELPKTIGRDFPGG